jgi:hypothetical protein
VLGLTWVMFGFRRLRRLKFKLRLGSVHGLRLGLGLVLGLTWVRFGFRRLRRLELNLAWVRFGAKSDLG